jgi:phosphoserine phosphatase RsbU/P
MRRPLLALVVGMLAASACAQTFNFENGRQPVSSLDGKWRFHPGDDPHWAQPGFDDSSWELLDNDRPWYGQGHPGLSGMVWYRFKVELPAGVGPLSIQLTQIMTAYEVYADGKKIDRLGNLWLHAPIIPPKNHAFALPPGDDSHPRTLTLALRVWHEPIWASYAAGGPRYGGVTIGNSDMIAWMDRLQAIERTANFSDLYVDAVLRGIIGLVVLWLFLLRRGEREYLWFALIQIFGGAEDVLDFAHAAYGAVPIQLSDLLDAVLGGGFWIAGLFFIATILRVRRGFWFRLGLVLILISPLPVPLYWFGWISVPVSALFSSFLVVPSQVWILALLAARARRRDPDALLLVIPVLLVNGFYVVANVTQAAVQFGFLSTLLDLFNLRFNTQPFPIGIYTLLNIAYSVALLAFLIRRLSLSRRKEELLEGQMEAARQVQQRLVPALVPSIAGYEIRAAYLPAAEVGGDFYQALEQRDGSALILVGDVSGKGLKAAMTGVLAIGAARTLASEQLSPGKLLARLNDEMTGSQDGGFITCLCAHITSDGAATFANAGHLSPYRNGEEIEVENGLPLGVLHGVEYAETTVQLNAGETLTLLSDGVVEARNAAGELFGFERTRAISTEASENLAEAARAFGQEDDITVLSLTLVAVEVAHA